MTRWFLVARHLFLQRAEPQAQLSTVQLHERLPAFNRRAFFDEHCLDGAAARRLQRLHVAFGHERAARLDHDINLAEPSPDERGKDEADDDVEQAARGPPTS